jgi:alpha-mannosidase
MKNSSLLSRRQMLQGSGLLLSGVLLNQLTGAFGLPVSAAQVNPKRLYIAPDDHTDYMWTADEATYRQAFLDTIDYYLNLADSTAGERSEHQSRWNCDGSFWVWTYEKYKSQAAFNRLISRMRSGHISMPLTTLVTCYGGIPAEAVLRGMYYAGRLERHYGLRFTLAAAIENQTMPYGLGALWAGAGAKYSWQGICGCASQVTVGSFYDRPNEIYWWVGPDGSKILMKWYSLTHTGGSVPYDNQSLGGYAEAYAPSTAVGVLDSKCFTTDYNYGIAGAFGKGWDDLKTLTSQFVTVAKSMTNSNRTVIVSNEEDFFRDFEATYGSSLPSVSCSFGNEWDLYCASMAELSAQVKRAVEKLRAAEALSVLVSFKNLGFVNGRQTARDQAWLNLGLYWEHDWTGDGPGVSTAQRRDWQRRIASGIRTYVDTLYADAAQALGGMIQKSGSNLRFYAFNPLSWARTDVADFLYSGSTPVHVVDLSTDTEVPSQIVTLDGQTYLRILASDVPPVGYKVFEVRSGVGDSFSNLIADNSGNIENSVYQLSVAQRGAIISLLDKTRSNQEFAQNIGGRTINDLGSSTGTLAVENQGPVSVTLKATVTTATPLKHVSRITLFRNSRRIDIRNEINQNFSNTFTWAFGFNLTSPDVWHEEVGAIIRARLTTDGGHYSPTLARYDWLTLNHFADMSGTGPLGITLSNADCYFMRLGNSSPTSLDTATPQISPLVGGQVDGTDLGIPSQGGDSYFLQRFALQTHGAYDPVAAMRFALEHQNPLVTSQVTGGSDYPATSYSLLTISSSAGSVLLWALKPCEDSILNGFVARVWNLSNSPVNDFSLTWSPGPILDAGHVTHIETPVEQATLTNGVLTESLSPWQMKTFSLDVFDLIDTFLPLVKRSG